MGLKFGWRARVSRESIWRGDEALHKPSCRLLATRGADCDCGNVPAAALASWHGDPDASHLRAYATHGQPQIIRWRTLTAEEIVMCEAFYQDATNSFEAGMRAWLLAFRLAVNFPGKEDQRDEEDQSVKHSIVENEKGRDMLAEEFVKALMEEYPGIVAFYGSRIINASRPTAAEKKASSPPSTSTPSSAAESTPATTEASPQRAGA